MNYSIEENTLQLISLLKEHNIRKVIASPGNTNITFVGSIQNDPFFEIYSCVDERSAAYMACGLSEESGEPVIISCTGATAARNYPSALTEAYYRKLPILAITSSQHFGRTGHLIPQFTDRTVQFNDICVKSVQIPYPYSSDERWSNNVKINSALLELRRKSNGPVHINIETIFSHDFSVKELPKERVIRRYFEDSTFPEINAKKVIVFIGSHPKFSKNLENMIDEFCEKYNGVVLCDQTSNYKGKYRVLGGLVAGQLEYNPNCMKADLIIHLGEISGAYYNIKNSDIWRVNADGEIRDTFRTLKNVFEMKEEEFFDYYNKQKKECNNTLFDEWKKEIDIINSKLPEIPLSNVWMCQQTAHRLPENSVLYLGILNSLRSWNLWDVPNSVYTYSNVGGFGIDGIISTCVGASLYNKDKLYYCILGDLATFYDLNVLGNRHIGNNLRIMVSNNGTGYEMHCTESVGHEFGSDTDKFFSAGGHNGNKSRKLLKDFAEDLGFKYIKAETKEEYLENVNYFVSSKMYEKPVLFEVFVDVDNDDIAYNLTKRTIKSTSSSLKQVAKNVLGEKGYKALKEKIKG